MLARVRSNLRLADLGHALFLRPEEPVERLEHLFAEQFGFPYGVLFSYGRSALRALCESFGWRDREILCPAYTCAEVPYALTLSGNRVAFVDSASDHFLPGAEEWRAVANTHCAMAIITPLFGYPVNSSIPAVRAAAPDAFILFDEAQSYGVADRAGLEARDADGMLLSLGLGKMATAISGGIMLLRDSDTHRRLCAWRDVHCTASSHVHTAERFLIGLAAWFAFREPALSLIDAFGKWFGLPTAQAEDWLPSAQPQQPKDAGITPSTFQARLGLRQLEHLSDFLATRRQIGVHYERRLREEGFRTFAADATPNWPRYPLPVAERSTAISVLRTEGIQVSSFLPYSCAELPAYRDAAKRCSNAALWGRSMINLPTWHGMTTKDADRVTDALIQIRRRHPQALTWPAQARTVLSPANRHDRMPA